MSEPEKTNLDVEEYSSQGMRNIRLGIPQGYTLHEPFRDYWPNVVFGIGKAEVILALFGFGYLLLTRLTISTAHVPTIFVLLAILLQLMLMIILGLLILYIVAVFVILALHSLFGVLNTDCENIFCGVFVGGHHRPSHHTSLLVIKQLFYQSFLDWSLDGFWATWRCLGS